MITEEGKVEFTEAEQAVVDKIIGDRLARESVHDMKEIVGTLKEFGYNIEDLAMTKAEIKAQAAEFRRAQEEAAKQQELEDLKDQAAKEGTSPELLQEIKSLKEELADIKGEREAKKQAEIQQKEADKTFTDQVKYFAEHEETKGIDLEKLNENPKFIKFLTKQRPSNREDFLVEVYKDFVDLVGGAEAAAIAKINANVERSTSSGKSKGDPTGGTYGLSAADLETVDEWNKKNPHLKMSYKEFSERKGGK